MATAPGQPACAESYLYERLRSLGVPVALPRDRIDMDVMWRHQRGSPSVADQSAAGLDDAIVLAVHVDALEGPGGGWNLMSVMDFKSAHKRSDVGLAVYDGRSRDILWSGMVRARRVLRCDDPELVDMLRIMTSRIE